MRKILAALLFLFIQIQSFKAQSGSGDDSNSKVRFGLRLTPQPSWFSSSDKNNLPNGPIMGYGFGLNVEIKFSSAASLLTGIGGDFEGGKIKFRNDPANNYQVCYFKDDADAFIQPKNNTPISDLKKAGNTVYVVSERKINSTFVSIPLILKLSTKEIGAMKYFGLFGVELGIRIKSKVADKYNEIRKFKSDSTYDNIAPSTITDIDISKDASLIPLRVGLNVGAGFEYRMVGNTAFFFSLNYFNSFTNFMRNDSKFMMYNWQTIDASKGNTNMNYKMVSQTLLAKAIRINLGFMF